MAITVKRVETAYVAQAWPLVKEFIKDALEKAQSEDKSTHNYTVDHVQAFLASGQWLLLVGVNENGGVVGAATVSFINYPRHRVAFITSIGGYLISSRDTFEQLKTILKAHGATKIQGLGRESIVRLWKRYNFEPRATLVEVLI